MVFPRKLTILLVAALALLAVLLPSPLTDSNHFKLSNGLEVVVVPVHKAPVVTQMVWYRIGGADEIKGKRGLAHFLEHLMFKGTHNYPEGVFNRTIAQLGGNNNAFTTYDFTVYHATVAKDNLPLVMKLEADRMRGLDLSESAITTERNVILEERLMRTDNVPSAKLSEKMRIALFGSHPYGPPVIGSVEDIKGLTSRDVQHFYDTYYAPTNALLVLAGDIDPKQARKLAETYYGSIHLGNAEARANLPVFEAPATPPAVVEHADPKVETPEWMRYYAVPSATTSANPKLTDALDLAAYLLAGHDNAALYKDLVIEKKTASYLVSGYDPLGRGPALFYLYAIPTAGTSLPHLEGQIDQALKDFVAHGVPDDVLARAKTALIADQIFSRDDASNLGSLYGEVYALGLSKDYIEGWEGRIKALTSEDILQALALLSHAPQVTGHLLPEKKS
jgi:zinc protease